MRRVQRFVWVVYAVFSYVARNKNGLCLRSRHGDVSTPTKCHSYLIPRCRGDEAIILVHLEGSIGQPVIGRWKWISSWLDEGEIVVLGNICLLTGSAIAIIGYWSSDCGSDELEQRSGEGLHVRLARFP